jgi:hypothetical protein
MIGKSRDGGLRRVIVCMRKGLPVCRLKFRSKRSIMMCSAAEPHCTLCTKRGMQAATSVAIFGRWARHVRHSKSRKHWGARENFRSQNIHEQTRPGEIVRRGTDPTRGRAIRCNEFAIRPGEEWMWRELSDFLWTTVFFTAICPLV